MLREKLQNYNIILASGSPRRHQFFNALEIPFIVDVRPVNEIFPKELKREQITNYLAQLKASAFTNLAQNDLVITSDTIVWKKDKAIEKPTNFNEAVQMLQTLSNSKHEVITSVCFTGKDFQKTVFDVTEVWFKKLSLEEITFYINTYKPYDKAGSYGIQEWIGYVGVTKIAGSFFNVMGLPTHLVYETLRELILPKN
jgi:septum formation protein